MSSAALLMLYVAHFLNSTPFAMLPRPEDYRKSVRNGENWIDGISCGYTYHIHNDRSFLKMWKQDLYCFRRSEYIYADMLLQIGLAEVKTRLVGDRIYTGIVEQVIDLLLFP
jgi:hypothetical protein